MPEQKSIQARRMERMEEDRQRIRERVDVFALLADIAAGHQVVEYEPRTHHNQKRARVKRFIQPNLDQRLRAADLLAQRLMPSLKSVDVANSGEPMKISVEVPFQLPGQEKFIEGTVARSVDEQVGRLNQAIEDAVLAEDDDDAGGGYV